MKIRISFIVLIMALLFTVEGYSQFNGRMGRGQYSQSQTNGKKQKKPDFVEDALAYFTKELKLDDFQAAAMREILAKNKEAANALIHSGDMPQREKKDRLNDLSIKIYEEASLILSAEQIEKYKKILKLEKEEPLED